MCDLSDSTVGLADRGHTPVQLQAEVLACTHVALCFTQIGAPDDLITAVGKEFLRFTGARCLGYRRHLWWLDLFLNRGQADLSTHFSFVISVGQPVSDLAEVHRTFDGAHQALALVYLETQLLRCIFEQLRLAEQFRACRAQLGCLLEHQLHHVVKVIRVAHRQVGHRPFADFTEQSLHVFTLERRLQSTHLI